MNTRNQIYHSDICSICYSNYEKTQVNECLILKCRHIFHESCAKKWMNQNPTCPLCKSKVWIPISSKEKLVKSLQEEIKIVKGMAMVATALCICEYLYFEEFPITSLRKSLIFLGFWTVVTVATDIIFHMVDSLDQNLRHRGELAKRINYIPLAKIKDK